MTKPFAFRVLFASMLAGIAISCQKGDSRKSGDGAPASAAEIPELGSLAIEARLEELPGPFPANELYDYVYIMKYRVVKVLRGEYQDSVILVGQYNPRIARAEIRDGMDSLVDGTLSAFQAGDTHRLALTDLDPMWTGAVEDGYFRDKRRRYFARWTGRR